METIRETANAFVHGMQADFYEGLKKAAGRWENNENIADAICTDAAGQLVIVINVMEG